MARYEFGTVVWSRGKGTVNLPRAEKISYRGGFEKIVEVLTDLGHQGWDVATCATAGSQAIWTIRREP